MFRQAFAGSRPASKAPLGRTRDPLLASSKAQHFVLPSGHSFIVRPPPSVLPPTVPIPNPSGRTTTPNAFLDSIVCTAPLPSTSSSSPTTAFDQLPASRRSSTRPAAATDAPKVLSESEVLELQSLRRSDPVAWTRSKLAHKFGVSPEVVARFGYGRGPDARKAEQVRRAQVESDKEEREEQWGWKKSIAREERKRRRGMW
ncbi:hypothetical protein JCM10212_001987 [Sporobolomyces blumeae]